MRMESFEWDPEKDLLDQAKRGVSFAEAQIAFADPDRVIAEDLSHIRGEKRYYCFGKAGEGIWTVRFTYGRRLIGIIGAGYWREGK